MNSINFDFEAPIAIPVDEEAPKVSPPSQSEDTSEYICGQVGNAHPYANPGRDQDRSRADECIPAQGCSRYVS